MQYDMIDITMVPVGVRDLSAVHVADMLEYKDAHILTAWNTISWKCLHLPVGNQHCYVRWRSSQKQVVENATVQVMQYGDEGGADAQV